MNTLILSIPWFLICLYLKWHLIIDYYMTTYEQVQQVHALN